MGYKLIRHPASLVVVETGPYSRRVTFRAGGPVVEIKNRGQPVAPAPDQIEGAVWAARRYLEAQAPEDPWTDEERAWFEARE